MAKLLLGDTEHKWCKREQVIEHNMESRCTIQKYVGVDTFVPSLRT